MLNRPTRAVETGEAEELRYWRIKAQLGELVQTPQSLESYLHLAVAKACSLLGAEEVVYWRYLGSEDAFQATHLAAADHGRVVPPVSPGMLQEAIASRQVRTVTQSQPDGRVSVFLLGPIFDAERLVGVLQVFVPGAVFSSEAAVDLGVVCEAIGQGLRTVEYFERLSYQATHDPLTGLANRRTFQLALAREAKLAERHGSALSLVVVDLDHFKAFNDTHGHAAGDDLLVEVSRALEQSVRSTDLVARYGGEEFVVILPHTDPEGAWAAAHKILEGIRALAIHPAALGGPATASVGVATLGADAPDPALLFATADRAMYRAKGSGRNQVCQAGR